ncbi:MAG: hypothetical protein JWN44_2065 [Myxococcales bacterium]|nr:hypothetical protein [Myxococcales bacterium]
MSRLRLLAAAVFVMLAAAGVAARAFWRKPVVVYCDNGTNEDVTVKVDGAQPQEVPRHDFRALTLSPGAHALVATSGGRTVEEWRVEGLRGQRWVWNVAARNDYAIYTMSYGDHRETAPPRQLTSGLAHFVMPAEVAQDFMQPLPSTVTVSHATKQATQQGIYHFPLHYDRPCCVAIVEQASHTK